MTESGFILLLVGATSTGGYLAARRRGRRPGRTLAVATLAALELVGSACLWFIVNVAVGLTAILAVRATGHFVHVYLLNDVSLIALSTLQGLLFMSWRRVAASRPRRAPAA